MIRLPVSVIVTYNSGINYLAACMSSLYNTLQPEDEIILVVNSENPDVHKLQIKDKRVRKIVIKEAVGHAAAANLGVASARHRFVAITDHDLVFQKRWLDHLWDAYNKESATGAVSCKLLDPATKNVLDYGIGFTDFNFAHPNMDLPANHHLVLYDRTCQMICSGGIFLKKEDFEEIGGFTQEFQSLYTDLDLSLKLKRKGLKCKVSAKSIAYHFGGDVYSREKSYKNTHLKADTKGVFMMRNADTIDTDMHLYYAKAIDFFKTKYKTKKNYLFCNLMNVVNQEWYENVCRTHGIQPCDIFRKRSGVRDAVSTPLFEIVGYNICKNNIPIAYFIDRYISLKENYLWWLSRKNKNDIIIDRNANVIHLELLH